MRVLQRRPEQFVFLVPRPELCARRDAQRLSLPRGAEGLEHVDRESWRSPSVHGHRREDPQALRGGDPELLHGRQPRRAFPRVRRAGEEPSGASCGGGGPCAQDRKVHSRPTEGRFACAEVRGPVHSGARCARARGGPPGRLPHRGRGRQEQYRRDHHCAGHADAIRGSEVLQQRAAAAHMFPGRRHGHANPGRKIGGGGLPWRALQGLQRAGQQRCARVLEGQQRLAGVLETRAGYEHPQGILPRRF
mmetsp:Transcript_52116/g.145475  ORF Transcript_52116/g.145475 Transcript_52116/m.145475 type:complete len:248 (-) Transcript_52116:302-1045(-)